MRSANLFVLFLAACAVDPSAADDGDPVAGKADGGTRRMFSMSATTVEKLGGSLDGVSPAVRTADAGHSAADYLASDSCLGALGPLGAWGPLGALGPVGDSTWNASTWISAAGNWHQWSEQMTDLGGPLRSEERRVGKEC